jgi:hypothetical protein
LRILVSAVVVAAVGFPSVARGDTYAHIASDGHDCAAQLDMVGDRTHMFYTAGATCNLPLTSMSVYTDLWDPLHTKIDDGPGASCVDCAGPIRSGNEYRGNIVSGPYMMMAHYTFTLKPAKPSSGSALWLVFDPGFCFPNLNDTALSCVYIKEVYSF